MTPNLQFKGAQKVTSSTLVPGPSQGRGSQTIRWHRKHPCGLQQPREGERRGSHSHTLTPLQHHKCSRASTAPLLRPHPRTLPEERSEPAPPPPGSTPLADTMVSLNRSNGAKHRHSKEASGEAVLKETCLGTGTPGNVNTGHCWSMVLIP